MYRGNIRCKWKGDESMEDFVVKLRVTVNSQAGSRCSKANSTWRSHLDWQALHHEFTMQQDAAGRRCSPILFDDDNVVVARPRNTTWNKNRAHIYPLSETLLFFLLSGVNARTQPIFLARIAKSKGEDLISPFAPTHLCIPIWG